MLTDRWPNTVVADLAGASGVSIFTKDELNRRHSLVRAELKRLDADVLIAQVSFPPASAAVETNVAWLTGTTKWRSTATVLLPQNGELCVYNSGSQYATHGGKTPFLSGQGAQLGAALRGSRRVAYAGIGKMDWQFREFLLETLPDVEIIDFTEELDRMKAVKSAEELLAIKYACEVQDSFFYSAASYIRPGRTYQDIIADSYKLLIDLGSDSTLMFKLLLWSGKNGYVLRQPLDTHNPPGGNIMDLGYRLQKDDWLFYIVETPGYGGYYSEMGRYFYFNEPCDEAKFYWNEAVKLTAYQASLLKPGATMTDILASSNDYLRARGAEEDYGFTVRGIGMLTIDRPQAYASWETMTIEPNMALSLQPKFSKDGKSAGAPDTYIVPESGAAYRPGKFPQELIVL